MIEIDIQFILHQPYPIARRHSFSIALHYGSIRQLATAAAAGTHPVCNKTTLAIIGAPTVEAVRVIADYIAGMTDNYLKREYDKFYN